jgi:hypothetical protein
LSKQKASITNTESLKKAIVEGWEAMPLELAEKLVASCDKKMPGSYSVFLFSEIKRV